MSDDQVTRMLVLLRKQRDAAEAQCDALTAERDALAATLTTLRADARELLDIFIEGGWAEAEDLPLLDRLHALLSDTPDIGDLS